ncbi:MAG: phenylacetate--CoA ligase family protein [Alphaproteobacteria bacterium]
MPFPLDAVNQTLDRLSAHPFYAGWLPGRVADVDDFTANVPLMRRDDLVAEMRKPGYGAFACPEAVRMNMSPMGKGLAPVMQTQADLDHMIKACRLHLDACAIGPDDVCAVFFGYHLFVAGLYYQSQMEAHGVTCIPLGPGEAARAVEVCNNHNVTVIAGNPSFSLKLIEAGLKPPRVFFAGGEAFTGNPTLYGAVQEAMPDTLLIDAFSLSEFLPVARTFPGGEGVHVFDELIHAEVVDPETGRPVADGERGELVLTHLVKQAQPLVRYRTGDLTVMRTTDPVCGRIVNLPRVVFGRTDEMVKVKGVKLYPSEIRSLLLGIGGLDGGYRLTVSGKDDGGDAIRLTLAGSAGGDAVEAVAARFRSQILVSADHIEIVAALDDGPMVVDERRTKDD